MYSMVGGRAIKYSMVGGGGLIYSLLVEGDGYYIVYGWRKRALI